MRRSDWEPIWEPDSTTCRAAIRTHPDGVRAWSASPDQLSDDAGRRSRTSDQKVEAERSVARVSARANMELYLMLKIGLAWAQLPLRQTIAF
jgi:hypothetical protein